MIAEDDKFHWTIYHHNDGEPQIHQVHYSGSQPSWEMTLVNQYY